MYLLNGKPIAPFRAFTHNDIQYPAGWWRLTTPAEKAAIGITEVPDPPAYDQRYYWGYDADGALIPKQLEDEEVLDENGEPTGQIQTGLKTQKIQEQKQIAASLLASSDWYVIRKNESGVEIPLEVLAYRGLIREISNTRESEIQAVATVAELKELLTGPQDILDPAWEAEVEDDNGDMIPNPEPQGMIKNPSVATPWPAA